VELVDTYKVFWSDSARKLNPIYRLRGECSKPRAGLKYQRVKIWNKIPSEIQSISFKSFKHKFKKTYTPNLLTSHKQKYIY